VHVGVGERPPLVDVPSYRARIDVARSDSA
jgi:hypothetical protein